MAINSELSCFILSAGYGTRMGDIGKELPKPLWRIGNLTLIEATKKFWERFGVSRFYANVYHGHDLMVKHLKELGIVPVVEDELLGSGGAYYNLKNKYPHLESVLAVNCDSFPLSYSKEKLIRFLNHENQALISMPVKSKEEFNRLDVINGRLQGIVKDYSRDGATYAGIAKICLTDLPTGKSKVHGFFDSVANFNEKNVLVKSDVIDSFLDFGTLENFYHSYFELLKENESIAELKDNLGLVPNNYVGATIFLDGIKRELDKNLEKAIYWNNLKSKI